MATENDTGSSRNCFLCQHIQVDENSRRQKIKQFPAQDSNTEPFPSLALFKSVLCSICNWGLSAVVSRKKKKKKKTGLRWTLIMLFIIYMLYERYRGYEKQFFKDMCCFDSLTLTKMLFWEKMRKVRISQWYFICCNYYLTEVSIFNVLVFNILVLLNISNLVKPRPSACQLHKAHFKYLHFIHLFCIKRDSFHLRNLSDCEWYSFMKRRKSF